MQNGPATLEDSLAVSFKVKHSLTILFSNCTPIYLVSINIRKHIFIQYLHMNGYRSRIHNDKKKKKKPEKKDILQ